jgi:hypothetical protein
MRRISTSNFIKYQILTVGAVLVGLKLLKAANFNWAVALSPFFVLIFIKIMLFVWGYIMYRKNR